jgi:tetratricopeptide (TPR) repeat protein
VAILRVNYSSDLAQARDALEAASAHRDALEPRERAIFNGLQRMLAVQPPDPTALVDALRPAVDKDPRDPVLRLVLGRGLHSAARFEEAKAELRQLIEIDPEFAPAYSALAAIHLSEYDQASTRRVLDACVERIPRAMLCLVFRARAPGMSCDEVETSARQIVAVLPSSPSGYSLLAETLVIENRPEQETLAVVEQQIAHMSEDERRRSGWRVHAALAFEYGHFAKADELSAEALERLPSDLEITPQAYWLRLLVAEEIGDRAQASAVVHAMRSRASLWRTGEWASMSGELLVHAVRSGAIDRTTFERERAMFRANVPAVWVAAPSSPEVASFKGWLDTDVRTAFTDDDARAADADFVARGLALRPRWETDVVEAGAVFLRAGDLERAREALARGLCDLQRSRGQGVLPPGVAMRRSLLLGRTLEAAADRAGACTAYGEVLRRWGAAPHSVTADEARLAARRLDCRHVR